MAASDLGPQLRNLLRQARSGVKPDRRGRIREEALSLRARALDAETRNLADAVLAAVGPRPGTTLTGPHKELARFVKRNPGSSPDTLAGEIDRLGFGGGRELPSQEIRIFQDALWPAITGFEERYRGFTASSADLERMAASIRALQEILPLNATGSRDALGRLLRDLEVEQEQAEARSAFDQLAARIARLHEAGDPGPDPARLREELRADRHATARADSPEVAEAFRQVERLVAIARIWPPKVADRFAQLLRTSSFDGALDLLDEHWERAESLAVDRREVLQTAANDLGARLCEEATQLASEARELRSTKVLVDMRERIRELWFGYKRLPEAAQLAEQADGIRDLDREVDSRIDEIEVASAREELASLPLDRIAKTVEAWRTSTSAAVQRLAGAIDTVLEVMDDVREVVDEVTPGALAALDQSLEALGPSPLSRAATALADDYRKGLRLVNAILDSTPSEAGAYPSDELQGLHSRFPQWRAVGRALSRIEDARLWREITDAAAERRYRDAETALNSLADKSERSNARRSVGLLERMARLVERPRCADVGRRDLRGAAAGMDELTQALGEYEDLRPSVEAAIQREFAPALVRLDAEVETLRGRTLDAALEAWRDLVAAADDAALLDEVKPRLEGWRQVVGESGIDLARRAIERRGAELEIASHESAGRFDDALQVLMHSERVLGVADSRAARRRLERARALARHAAGEDPHLEGILEVIRRGDVDPELVDLVVADFERGGTPARIASIARLLDSDPGAQLGRWALFFQEDNLPALAEQLVERESLAWVFLGGVARGPDSLAALRLLSALEETPIATSEAWGGIEETVQRSASALLDSLRDEVSALRDELNTQGFESLPLGASDADLRETLQAAIKDAIEKVRVAVGRAQSWRRQLQSASRLSDVSILLSSVKRLEQTAFASKEALEALGPFQAMLGGRSHELPDDLVGLAQREAPRVFPRVRAALRLVERYCDQYYSIRSDVDRLVAAHDNGGEGLTTHDLEATVRVLVGDRRYNFNPGQDRFNLVRGFGWLSFTNFLEELRAQVREMEGVHDWERRLRSWWEHSRHDIDVHLGRLERRSGPDVDAAVDALRDLLEKPDAEGRSVKERFLDPPTPSRSRRASELMAELRKHHWFRDLSHALEATDGTLPRRQGDAT